MIRTSRLPVYLVLDIGKTHKKIIVIDSNKQTIALEKKEFSEEEKNGVLIEPIEDICTWFLHKISYMVTEYKVTHVGISCHGGVFVLLDADNRVCAPVLSYMNTPQSPTLFDTLIVNPENAYTITSTPRMDKSFNLAVGYFNAAQLFPTEFSRAKTVLTLPQYIYYLLTGTKCTELSYIGCHTYLWDFSEWSWSSIANEIGFSQLAPAPVREGIQLGLSPLSADHTDGGNSQVKVAPGIHDSNASIIPYLSTFGSRFCLHSTGSWCVTMMPAGREPLRSLDRQNGIFHNISITGEPIKTHSFPGGLILNREIERAGIRNSQKYDFSILKSWIDSRGTYFLPSNDPDHVSIYSNLRIYTVEDYLKKDGSFSRESYFALVNLGIGCFAQRILESFELNPSKKIFVEGGFRRNRYYLSLLSTFLGSPNLYLSSIEEASALGTALFIDMLESKGNALYSLNYSEFELDEDEIVSRDELLLYYNRWNELYSLCGDH